MHCRAFAHFALDLQFAAVQRHDMACQAQAETRAVEASEEEDSDLDPQEIERIRREARAAIDAL